MDQDPSAFRRITRASRKRTQSTSAAVQVPARKKRAKETSKLRAGASTMDMKENCVKMQSVSLGLHKVQPPQASRLCCKENIISTTEAQSNSVYYTRSKRPQLPPGQTFLTSNHGTLEVTRDCLISSPVFPQQQPDLSSMEVFTDDFNTAFTNVPVNKQDSHRPIVNYFTQKETLHRPIHFQLAIGGTVTSRSPLPQLQWAQSAELWQHMREKDVSKSAPEAEVQIRHPGIVPSMRVILLDWMLEVCEEYRLHRETYYLAKDMYDRFMDTRTGVLKEQLQLIGVTCLFICSKIEEIYPPKVGEFAYVTDGACSVSNIIEMELIICKTLKWRLNHNVVSVNTWVNTYMQLHSHHLRPPGVNAREFEFPAFSPLEFTKIMQLLDLCTLDMNSRQFGSSVIAASAVYLASERSRPHIATITGFELSDIQLCINWMYPFAVVFSQKGPVTQKTFTGVLPQDAHNIQTHDISISMLDDARELRNHESLQNQLSYLQDSSVFMTPPKGERRCLAPINTTC